uniref:Uncharacterized protein n=1 Tax=Oryza punctata TaxID=4537 RepID=A0A0E0M3V7_ORYPU
MGDANGNPAQQGYGNETPAQQGLPPRHLIIPYAVAAAMANRPIRLASQAQLLAGGSGAAAQQPSAQHVIPAQGRRASRNPWSRTVPSLLADGKSYRIIDTSFTSEEALAPAPPPPLLVSAARRPVATSPQPIATAFAWPVPPRGWTVSPTTGRYRFGYGYGIASSSSAAPRAPTAPTTPRAPTPLLLLPAPPVPSPLVPAPPATAPPPAVPRGGWTASPTTSRNRFGNSGTSSSTVAPLVPVAHPAPPAPAPPVPTLPAHVPVFPAPPAPAPPAAALRGLTLSPTTALYCFGGGRASSSSAAPRVPTAPPAPPEPTTPVPASRTPAPPSVVPPGLTVSPTTARYSFGYGGASSSAAAPRVPTAPPALRAPAPHLRAPPTALPTPAAARGWTVSPTTARYSFGYGGANSSSAAPRVPTAPLALRVSAPHLRVLRAHAPHLHAPPAVAPPPAAAAPRGWNMPPTTGRYSFGYGGASSSSATPSVPTAPLALRVPAPHLRALRAPAPHLRTPPTVAPPPAAAAPRAWTMPPTTGRYSFSYSGSSSSFATPSAPIAPLALRAPAPHLRAPRAPTPPAAAGPPASAAPPSGLPSWPVLVRPPTGPARARLAPAAPAEAFEEYLVERRAIEATVDDTPWEVIGSSKRTGAPMFAVAGGGRDRAELEAREARERRKNRMDKRKAAAAARAQQPPPPPPAARGQTIHQPALV